ncbi:hypothetical protein [Thiocapsa bogorovii]|uniref:hypothetical protein n=1 Tax=Thiocapsa bogorovii TaxID=521689 RepID=UPI001E48928B|nr:hypothetical protein [Thiocapsa bogorovii]UHD14805.1 hypothetical protein LT988_16105 [Thiocapsa bogorovii]
MSAGAVKGIEVLLIAGGLFWFAYAQMKALKKPSPGAERPETDHKGEEAARGTDDAEARDKS